MNRYARVMVCVVGLGAILGLAKSSSPSRIRLIYNPSASAPVGWYLIERAAAIRVNDFVLAWLPREAAWLAGERGYLPVSIPILKRVGAIGSQEVCGRGHDVLIDGRVVAHGLRLDSWGRNLAVWTHCRLLSTDEIFLLSLTNAASFDSRYFGPIERRNVIGKAIPLWTW